MIKEEKKLAEYNLAQVQEMKRFHAFLGAVFSVVLDLDAAACLWVSLFADQFRRGEYMGFESHWDAVLNLIRVVSPERR